jgi:hypothetical protein
VIAWNARVTSGSGTAAPPLAGSAAVVAAALGLPVRCGPPGPDDGPGWTRCADVDAAYVAGWERAVAAGHVREYGLSHPTASAAYVLGWYAGVPAMLGGALFRATRRVPRLDRDALAFRRGPEEYPDAVALLDGRFWCLAADPDASRPTATVVEDESALAAVLRAQVRAHADAFLAGHPFRPLPRRALLGAFTDGLDTGLWLAGDDDRLLPDAALALPGPTLPASTLQVLVDGRGRRHLDRRTLSCCYYFKVDPDAGPCGTCPRIPPDERLRRLTSLPDEIAGQ